MKLTEDDYNMLKAEELAEIVDWFDFQEEWDNNPMNILLKKQINEIGESIDLMIKNWPEVDE